MRLHLLSNLYPPDVLGGYELLAADVAARLRARGHEVRVVTTGTARAREHETARILRLALPFGRRAGRNRLRHLAASAWNRAALVRELRSGGRPDAVLVMSMRRLGLEPLRVYSERGVPSVVTVNDDWPASYMTEPRRATGWQLVDRGPLARHTWRGVTVRRAVYLSDSVRRAVLASGAPLPLGHVCAQGIDPAAFVPRPFRPIDRVAPQLLFVGRLHSTKAPDVAIDTLAALHATGIDAHLTMAGVAADPSYQAELHARAAAVASHVTWLGQVPRDRLAEVYRGADVLLYPLRWDAEAQGLTYMEAMACGVPVLAHPRGGARELLDAHDVTARVARCDGEAFAETLLALAADVDRQRAIVAGAFAMLREHASLERYVDTLESELAAAARQNTEGAWS